MFMPFLKIPRLRRKFVKNLYFMRVLSARNFYSLYRNIKSAMPIVNNKIYYRQSLT